MFLGSILKSGWAKILPASNTVKKIVKILQIYKPLVISCFQYLGQDRREKMQGETERKVNLTHLVPKNSLDAAIRISSLNGWSKTEQLGQGAYGEVWKYAAPMEETPVVAGKHLKVQLWNLNEMQKSDLKNVSC